MGELVGVGHEVHVDLIGKVCLPVVGGSGEQDDSEEEVGEHCADCGRLERATAPALDGSGCLTWRERELKRVLRGAD